jgi:hypothetical protein
LFLSQVPKGCVANDDGITYAEFAINTDDWETIQELAAIMWPAAQVVNILQGDYVTISLVYPMLGTMLYQLSSHKPVCLHDERKDVDLYTINSKVMEPHMPEARHKLRGQIIQRFFTDIRDNDITKICIATLLGIRYVGRCFASVHL